MRRLQHQMEHLFSGLSPALRRPLTGEYPLINVSRSDDMMKVDAACPGIERDKLELTEGGAGLLVVGEEGLNDTRCGRCGSLLFSVVRDGEYVHVALGSLADPPSLRPTKHIFVGSKAPWFTITDDLPQYEEHVVGTGSTGE